MRVLCVLGKYQYGNPERGESAEYMAFPPAFRRLGHEVYHFESGNRERQANLPQLNRDLLSTVAEIDPDIILTVQGSYEIWMETWQLIAMSSKAALIQWSSDDSWKYDGFSKYIGSYFDVITTTYPQIVSKYRRDGHQNVFLTQWAASADMLTPPLPASECSFLVSFIGTAHGSRRKYVEQLRMRGIKVACFGHGWPNGAVTADEMFRIIRQSTICLNFSNSRGPNQIKARVFEIPGAGGFLLTEDAPGIEEYYVPHEEIAVFLNIDQACDLIRFYLDHPYERDRVVLAGYERTSAEHTYDKRLFDLTEYALKMRQKRPGSDKIDIKDDFDRVASSHRLQRHHELVREVMLSICQAVWGEQKGARVARRLLFETSVRLVGATTFTSRGLPGRFFPGI